MNNNLIEQGKYDWILGSEARIVKRKKKPKEGIQLNTLYLCNLCDSVWEYYYRSAQRNRELLTYKHIPTYGLERRTCKLCKGECNG
jgi:hypothetical protein